MWQSLVDFKSCLFLLWRIDSYAGAKRYPKIVIIRPGTSGEVSERKCMTEALRGLLLPCASGKKSRCTKAMNSTITQFLSFTLRVTKEVYLDLGGRRPACANEATLSRASWNSVWPWCRVTELKMIVSVRIITQCSKS